MERQTTTQLAPRTLLLLIGVGVAAGLVCASLLYLLWAHQGLPDKPALGALAKAARPEGFRLFVTFALPAVVVLPSLVIALMVLLIPADRRAMAQPAIRESLRQDAVSYLILPVMALLPVIWRELGNGFLATGIIFLGTLSFKAAILFRLLWKAHLSPQPGEGRGVSGRAQFVMFLAGWVVLGLAAGWTNQAVSSTKEEAGWLLEAEALQRGPGFLENRQAQIKAAGAFYWEENAKGELPAVSRDSVFALFLSPVLAAGGRLGVLIAFAALMAFMACQMLAWLEEAGVARKPAAAATVLIVLSAPVWVAGQQILPDVPAILLFVLGLRLLLRLDRHGLMAGLGLAAVAAALGLFKMRLAALTGGLLACTGLDILWRRWGWKVALPSFLALCGLAAAAIWFVPRAWWPKAVVFSWGQILAEMQDAPSLWRASGHALAGVFLDQTYGVFITAPVLLLALAGVPACLALRPRAALLALTPALLYVAAVCLLRWHLWYGGQAGPGRLIMVALPALALPLATAMSGLRKPWWRLWALIPLVLGLAYTWLISLIPFWRYSLPTGVNPLVASLEDALGLFLRQMLPSLLSPSLILIPWLVGAAALLVIWAIPIWRLARRDEPQTERGLSRNEILALVLICGTLVMGGLAWGSLAQVSAAEAEGLQARGARLWSVGHGPVTVRGQSLSDGGRLYARLYFSGGEAGIRLVGKPLAEGRITLSLDGRLFQQPWPRNQESSLVELGPVKKGTHKIEVGWTSCPEPQCNLNLDRLDVRQAAPQTLAPAASPQSSR